MELYGEVMVLYHVEVFIGPMDTNRDGCGGTFCGFDPADAADRARVNLRDMFPEVEFACELGAIVTDGTGVCLRQPALNAFAKELTR